VIRRPWLAALLALLFIAACRIHVTIWLLGRPVARPPVAGLLLAAIALACAIGALMVCRSCLGFRSSPYPRDVPEAT
jgi:hypothetical protein